MFKYKNLLNWLMVIIIIGVWALATVKSAAQDVPNASNSPEAVPAAQTPLESPKPPAAPSLPPKVAPVAPKPTTKHPVLAVGTISADDLQTYLLGLKSPLAPYAAQIAASNYWSMIVAVCIHEQNQCTSAPYWNYWGLKGKGDCGTMARGFAKFCSAQSAITEIDKRMASYAAHFGPNIEDWRGRYCVDSSDKNGICWQWEYTVIKQKALIETNTK